MKAVFTLSILCLVLAVVHYSDAAASALSIREATTFCERAVPAHCIATTCPAYCNALRSAKRKASCKNQCNKDKRCKLRPIAGSDDPRNQALDAQSRDQLWACIAEKRDPNASKTGRRTTPWQQLETPSYRRALGRS